MKIDKSKLKEHKILFIIAGIILIAVIIASIFFAVNKGSSDADVTPSPESTSDNVVSDATEDVVVKDDEQQGKTDTNTESVDDSKPKNIDASYEHWLASSIILGISMHYYDVNFDIKGAYLTSETELNAHTDSKGVYVVFTINGEERVIYSKPIDSERDAAGTIDISEQHIGFATFDEVVVKTSELEGYTQVDMEELSEIIEQLLLVTIYEH